jgi:hypothetical protein
LLLVRTARKARERICKEIGIKHKYQVQTKGR